MSSTNNKSHDVDDVEVQLVIDQGSNNATPIRHQFLKEKEAAMKAHPAYSWSGLAHSGSEMSYHLELMAFQRDYNAYKKTLADAVPEQEHCCNDQGAPTTVTSTLMPPAPSQSNNPFAHPPASSAHKLYHETFPSPRKITSASFFLSNIAFCTNRSLHFGTLNPSETKRLVLLGCLLEAVHLFSLTSVYVKVLSLVILWLAFRLRREICHTDPGIVLRNPPIPTRSSREEADGGGDFVNSRAKKLKRTKFVSISNQDVEITLCETCKIYKLRSTHHCSQCDVCVVGFDHHCNWLGCCIGHENRCNFLRFTGILCVWIGVITISCGLGIKNNNNNNNDDDGGSNDNAQSKPSVTPILYASIMIYFFALLNLKVVMPFRRGYAERQRLGRRDLNVSVLIELVMRGNVIGPETPPPLSFKTLTTLKASGIALFVIYAAVSLIYAFENFLIIFNFAGVILGSFVTAVGYGFTAFQYMLKAKGTSSKAFFRHGWNAVNEEERRSCLAGLAHVVRYVIFNDDVDYRPQKGEERYFDLMKKTALLDAEIKEDDLTGLEAVSPRYWNNDV
ncbi:hypothetical protein TrVE_jg7392 [Triparma verrucosa]|uniref:Palmitoyltransferase n=1 Tax=Triparma verrucosa TaxID=1606542 RepID=A0A9W7CER4_9STRA|nr:hypothetical protein TrVE_jg7392 [Triparma verrucosa]